MCIPLSFFGYGVKRNMKKMKRFALLSLGLVATVLALFTLASQDVQASSPIGSWKTTTSMYEARSFHTATLLRNGSVLVAGGWDGSTYLATAELYHPKSGTWTQTGSMHVARIGFTATLLKNGKVLVVGGIGNGGFNDTLASAELYDPVSGTWTLISSMHIARSNFTATLLKNGKVLVAGGNSSYATPTASAELYDPAKGSWSLTGNMSQSRAEQTATRLNNGLVLIAGGVTGNSLVGIASAEIYNPHTGTWNLTKSMNFARREFTATLLKNGQVLVAGGGDFNNMCCVAVAELYNPHTGTWSNTGTMIDPRSFHTATLLLDGRVLVEGGQDVNSMGHYGANTAELYSPATGQWTATPNLSMYRFGQSETLLQNGEVLVAGGGDFTPTPSAELFKR